MRYILSILILACATALHAQQPADTPGIDELNEALRARIGLIARPGKDSVVLRWAPSKPGVWLIGKRIGYRVERAVARDDGRPGAFTPLLDTAVKPWPLERWIAYADAHPPREDSTDYVAIAYNLLDQFGDDAPARDDYSDDELKSIAERKNELEMRFGFAMYSADRSAAAAEGLGVRFVDRTVAPGTTYIYRVYLAGSAGDYRLDTGSVLVTARQPGAMGRQPITAVGEDRGVLLRWKANPVYSSYFVERSENNGVTFRRLNKVPLVTLRPSSPTEDEEELWFDSTARGATPYIYRIYGTTSFADEDPIGEGRATTRDATAPVKPFLPNPEHIAARAVRIRWIPGDPASPDLAGFHVSRGGSDSGPFDRLTGRLLPPSTLELIDSSFRDDGPVYYLVEAVDTAGNTSRSNSAYVALIDSTPPESPAWIDGRMDSNGVVTLRLRANPERDLMGYRLLRANAADHEFSVIREAFDSSGIVADTIHYDTVEVKTLTRNVYYRAVALDRNYNESEFSRALAVPRPDVIPPVSPVITDVFVTDSSVRLRFAASSSEDVAYQAVYRREAGGAAWDSIARTGGVDTLFLDRSVKQNVVYEYAMLAVDSSGLRSAPSMAVVARPYDPGTRPDVTGLTGIYDAASGRVTLRWNYDARDEEHWFVVYRGDGATPLRSYARIGSAERTFVDDKPGASESRPVYAVRMVARSGAQSTLGEKVEVRIER